MILSLQVFIKMSSTFYSNQFSFLNVDLLEKNVSVHELLLVNPWNSRLRLYFYIYRPISCFLNPYRESDNPVYVTHAIDLITLRSAVLECMSCHDH